MIDKMKHFFLGLLFFTSVSTSSTELLLVYPTSERGEVFSDYSREELQNIFLNEPSWINRQPAVLAPPSSQPISRPEADYSFLEAPADEPGL